MTAAIATDGQKNRRRNQEENLRIGGFMFTMNPTAYRAKSDDGEARKGGEGRRHYLSLAMPIVRDPTISPTESLK